MPLLWMSISGAILILAVAALRIFALDRIPKDAFLLLWLVALLRLLLPFSATPAAFSSQATIQIASGWSQGMRVLEQTVAENGPRAFGGFHWLAEKMSLTRWMTGPNAVVLWAIGAAALGFYFLLRYRQARRVLSTAIPAHERLSYALKHKARQPVQLFISDQISTPLTYGLIRPRIVFPKAMLKEQPKRVRFALEHELTHIRRFDMLWKSLLLLALCLHWFNPVVWLMYTLAVRDLELTCDERVLRRLKGDLRAEYAMTLIEFEERRAGALPLAASAFARNPVEERVRAIMKYRSRTLAGWLASALLVGVSLCVFAVEFPQPVYGSAVSSGVMTTPFDVYLVTDSSADPDQRIEIATSTSPAVYDWNGGMPETATVFWTDEDKTGGSTFISLDGTIAVSAATEADPAKDAIRFVQIEAEPEPMLVIHQDDAGASYRITHFSDVIEFEDVQPVVIKNEE